MTEPDRVVIAVDGAGELTSSAWEARSDAVARGLAAGGAGAGSRVGLLFDGRRWADFAVAWLGVRKAGAVAVLLSPGASAPDLARAVAHSGMRGLVGAPGLAPAGLPIWLVGVEQLEGGKATAPAAGSGPALEEVVYPAAPLAPPAPSRPEPASVAADGWLVHAWAPGSAAGLGALRWASDGGVAATVGSFDPDRLCAMVEERRATAFGLTPALAAAVMASGAAGRHDVSSVTRILLGAAPSRRLRDDMEATFQGAEVIVLGAGRSAGLSAGAPFAAPVAVSQEGMLWHEQFAAGSFNLPCLVRRYRGPLDVAALDWALRELARRHQPLRSTFALDHGEPGQVVGDAGSFGVGHEDLSAVEPSERDAGDAGAAALLADASRRPFDLVWGPLFEPRIVHLGPHDALLVVRLHHTVFDDWSVDVFRRELSALYAARLAGAPSPLAEPATSFADFCRRERARLAGDDGAAQRAWWRAELAGAPLAVQLPIAGAEPGGPLRVDLPPALADGIRALAPRLRATTFMTVLAAFAALVSRATGQDDLVMATVVAHRDQTDVEALIGCFTKKVPLRLRLDGDPTFAELVGRVRVALLGSLAHQDIGFDAAVHEALGRTAAEHCVVPQVSVVFQAEAPQRVKLTMPGLSVGPYEAPAAARGERHFSAGADRPSPWGDGMYLGTFLILSLQETEGGLALIARGVFDRVACQRLLDDFVALLSEAVADPSSKPTGHAGPSAPDVVDLRGLRASPSRIEAALAGCPGVVDVAVAVRDDGAGEPRLVAYVVSDGGPAPSLGRLRTALWAVLPGVMCPSAVIDVPTLARRPDGQLDVAGLPVPPAPADPEPDVLAAMWAEIDGRPASPRRSYGQDFSFLGVLAEAREAGLDVPDEQVARCRTPEMLTAALAALAALAARP